MDKQDMEKEFLSNLERILDGKEIEPGPVNEDCRTALDFAKKMMGLRVTPSPVFHDRLKEKLLRNMEKQESITPSGNEWSFWERLWETWRQPVWRTVTVGLLSALIIVGIMGRSGMFSQFTSDLLVELPPTPATGPAPEPPPAPLELQVPVDVVMTTEEESYQAGEEITIEFVFINKSDEQQTIEPFPPLVEITRPELQESVRSFPSGSAHRTLSPGEAVEYELDWNQLDSRGQPVLPGWFKVYAREISITENESQRTIITSGGGCLLINYPQGAMDLDIALDQSRTINGVTVTLEKAEFSEEGASFYAFTASLDHQQSPRVEPDTYPPPEPPTPEPVIAHAQYTFNGVTKDAGYAGFGFRDDGIELSWMRLDPFPSDAGELTFTITRLGEFEGPWEFCISLE